MMIKLSEARRQDRRLRWLDAVDDAGQQRAAGRAPLRAAPRARTAFPPYAWLHRLQLIDAGAVDVTTQKVRHDVYVVC